MTCEQGSLGETFAAGGDLCWPDAKIGTTHIDNQIRAQTILISTHHQNTANSKKANEDNLPNVRLGHGRGKENKEINAYPS